MKLNLFLSVVSLFTIFHLCKAGPLRHLQKRAVFYIANETACVVDNIVYSSGDPIPTDDPCEACRCRPPGFACVLKECKIKPGCRAVRHAQQCCPEYICGCEHSGRFYQDGDEIQDPKNPCYKCYCQGSSIACAFVDCIFRDECDSVFLPGECCPTYTNCSRDTTPDRNLFIGVNALPPVNLLPAFNDELFQPIVLSTDPPIELTENPNPIQPEESNDNSEEEILPIKNESEDILRISETVEPEILETEDKNLDTEVEEKDTEPLESSKEEEHNLSNESADKEVVESVEETKLLLNSESDINKDDVTQNSEAPENGLKLQTEAAENGLKLQTEAEKELPQTTVPSKPEEDVNEAEVTETPLENESTSTEITEKDPPIKNSASENSKSLKLSDNDQLDEVEKAQQDVKQDEKTDETTTELVPEATSTVPTGDLKESSTVESKPESAEIAPEESQANPQATIFRMNNAKIKSESAETVTIVVHVKESPKLPTETDFVAETVTPVSLTSVTEESLLKSNDEIISTDSNKESSEPEENKSTSANFEIFATKKEISEIELTSKLPPIDQNSGVQERSDEADNIALDAEENHVKEDKVSNSESGNDSSVTTTTMGIIEVSKEARTDEEISGETKVDESKNTESGTDTSKPLTTESITDSASSSKPEKSTTELTNEKPEELTVEKEPKSEKNEEIAAEIREDGTKLEETNVDKTTPVQSEDFTKKEEISTQAEKTESTTENGAYTSEKKVQETTLTNIVDKPEIRTNDEIETEKNEEKTTVENVDDKTTEGSKSELSTESQNQGTEESKLTSPSDN